MGRFVSKKLYVGNLAPSVSSEDLRQLFAQSGPVLSVKISMDHKSRSQGFAFVDMASAPAAEQAISDFHGIEFAGQALTVNIAKASNARDIRKTLARQRNRGKTKK